MYIALWCMIKLMHTTSWFTKTAFPPKSRFGDGRDSWPTYSLIERLYSIHTSAFLSDQSEKLILLLKSTPLISLINFNFESNFWFILELSLYIETGYDLKECTRINLRYFLTFILSYVLVLSMYRKLIRIQVIYYEVFNISNYDLISQPRFRFIIVHNFLSGTLK